MEQKNGLWVIRRLMLHTPVATAADRLGLYVERPPYAPIEVALESRSLLLHDFSHFAVECEMRTDAGFYGRVASGWSLEALRGSLTGAEQEAMMAIERRVALLQSAFKKNFPTSDPAFDRLRRIWGAWKKVKSGQRLTLSWPSGELAVVLGLHV